MNCPYCTEAIPEAAIVCPTCQRDLLFFKPISDRLSKAEKTIKDLGDCLQGLDTRSAHPLGLRDVASTVAVFSSLVLTFFFIWTDWRPGITHDLFWESLAIGAPFFPAITMGVLLRRVRPSAYLLLGFIAGCAGYIEMLVLYAIGRVHESLAAAKTGSVYVIALPGRWYWSMLIYPVVGSLFFLVGGICGERLRGRHTAGISQGGGERAEQLQKWLQSLSPYAAALLTLLTAIVTHYIDPKGH